MSTQVFTLPLSAPLSEHVSPNILPSQVVGSRDKEVWAVVPASALSWHCITLPSGLHKQKNRLLPVLQALLEEHVLDEPENLHIALQPDWQAGSQVWVATCQKAWLQAHLNHLQSMGHHVHRIVPEWAPAPLTVNENLKAWVSGVPEDAWLWVSHSQGAWRLPLQAGIQWWAEQLNTLALQEVSEPQAFKGLILQAEPAVANLAQKSLQTLQSLVAAPMSENLQSWRVVATPATERFVQAANSAWDLAQFDFAAHGSARWRQSLQRAWQQFAHDTAWRPVRWSLAILIAVQWVGLNAVAWQLNDKVKAQREQQKNILTQTFKPLRECLYNYHRKGLDKLTINQAEALENIANALQGLKDVHRIKPSSYNMQVFFYSKGDEIVNLFKPLSMEKKQPISELCKLVDPGNITKYERIVQ